MPAKAGSRSNSSNSGPRTSLSQFSRDLERFSGRPPLPADLDVQPRRASLPLPLPDNKAMSLLLPNRPASLPLPNNRAAPLPPLPPRSSATVATRSGNNKPASKGASSAKRHSRRAARVRLAPGRREFITGRGVNGRFVVAHIEAEEDDEKEGWALVDFQAKQQG